MARTKRAQNPVQVAMMKRHGSITTAMRDKRDWTVQSQQ